MKAIEIRIYCCVSDYKMHRLMPMGIVFKGNVRDSDVLLVHHVCFVYMPAPKAESSYGLSCQ